jgi:hypothetical protein
MKRNVLALVAGVTISAMAALGAAQPQKASFDRRHPSMSYP